jgi:homoserine dehydrogenase
MTREVLLIQLGLGGVGQALVQQVLAQRGALAARDDIMLSYWLLADSSGALVRDEPLPPTLVTAALHAKQAGQKLADLQGGHTQAEWSEKLPTTPCIVVDTTAADSVEEGLVNAVVAGHRVVLANKRPLTGNLDMFTVLTQRGGTRYEATVGAGLPVMSTLRNLLDSGDELIRVEACMSGTLGYLCTALEEGTPLSEAVHFARSRGWTEPDPRDDLSGADVARKALILARTCGLPWSMAHVPGVPWFPADMAALTVDEFMQQLPSLDADYVAQVEQARASSTTLRYVATVEPEGASIDLRPLPLDHPLAALRGTDNLFAFTTARYEQQPLIVRGPGAGTAVTAAGVLADIIATAREM